MTAAAPTSLALRLFYREVKKFQLRPVKRLNFQFDPFHQNVNSLREFLYHVSSRKIRKTNELCVIKTDVVNDRSEPTVNVILHNGVNVTFKTANLTTTEIAEEFNKIIDRFNLPEEEPEIKLKGVGSKIGRKKK